MADLQDTGAQEAPPMNKDTVRKIKRAERLELRLKRIEFLAGRTKDEGVKAALAKESTRRKAELHFLATTLEARLA